MGDCAAGWRQVPVPAFNDSLGARKRESEYVWRWTGQGAVASFGRIGGTGGEGGTMVHPA